ncbi:hypothetical protein BST61_g8517 [Cercospora zeina]
MHRLVLRAPPTPHTATTTDVISSGHHALPIGWRPRDLPGAHVQTSLESLRPFSSFGTHGSKSTEKRRITGMQCCA